MCCDVLANTPSSGNKDFQFAVFGNGDSRYSNTYNAAASKIYSLMKRMGGSSLMHGIWQGDTAAELLPLRSLNSWWKHIQPSINDLLSTSVEASTEGSKPAEDAIQKYDDQQEELLSTLKDCTLVVTTPKVGTGGDRSLLISLDIGNESFEELSCVQVLPFNSPAKVDQALKALCVDASHPMNLVFDGESPTFGSFLTEFVDLECPFLELEWLKSLALASQRGLSLDSLRNVSVLEVLERVTNTDFTPDGRALGYCLQRDICLDMSLLTVKTYSIASSLSYASDRKGTAPATGNKVDIMVKINQDGRFSDTFLNDFPTPAPLKYRFVDSRAGPRLRENYLATFVIVATGAGFGSVRCLLQWRIATTSGTPAAGQRRPSQGTGISLFLGLKESDVALTTDVLEEAKSLGIIDTLNIVLSNPEKRRVYDELPQYDKEIRSKLMKKQGFVFVCAGAAAAQGTKAVFEIILGGDVKNILGERYVEEVF
jgi:sulfite reductase alpha subunit-like flavoprotein